MFRHPWDDPIVLVRRRIVSFRPDDYGVWIAELECGHAQHVRHDPPWTSRPWVATMEGRAQFIGHDLQCPFCLTTRPVLIVSCDWSVSPRKRWLAGARLLANTSYEVEAPVPVNQTYGFFPSLRELAPEGSVLAGFDFPIGLPRIYAQKAGIAQFTIFLRQLGAGPWADFYHIAEAPDEVSVARPFYPRTPGGTSKQQLVEGLGLKSAKDLLRACDSATTARGKACEIFWTVGANQVGRAAIAGWRDLLAPAVRDQSIAIWPFDGTLSELFTSERIVVAEIYPAESYGHVGLSRGFGKTSREGRRSQAKAILTWCDLTAVAISPDLVAQIEDGFGNADIGEDRFDAVMGALGMIEVVGDVSRFAIPDDPEVRNVEGWILGMRAGHRDGMGALPTPAQASRAPRQRIVKK
jgi:hypothetical protein